MTGPYDLEQDGCAALDAYLSHEEHVSGPEPLTYEAAEALWAAFLSEFDEIPQAPPQDYREPPILVFLAWLAGVVLFAAGLQPVVWWLSHSVPWGS